MATSRADAQRLTDQAIRGDTPAAGDPLASMGSAGGLRVGNHK